MPNLQAQQISGKKTKTGINERRYYRCRRTPVNCKGVSMRADDGDELIDKGIRCVLTAAEGKARNFELIVWE